MAIAYQSEWHSLSVSVTEGCKQVCQACRLKSLPKCGEEREIEFACTAMGCPEGPNGEFRCALEHVYSDGLFEESFSELEPGSYEARYTLTRDDYNGEADEDLEIRVAEAVSS